MPVNEPSGQPIDIMPIGDAAAEARRPDRTAESAALTATTITADVLVVGGGPAGAAAAYWLARHGHDVMVVEREDVPAREDVR